MNEPQVRKKFLNRDFSGIVKKNVKESLAVLSVGIFLKTMV